ncbi:MAG: LPXTG cell wall anchor domain-containing protein [Ruminiclostridium sp.]
MKLKALISMGAAAVMAAASVVSANATLAVSENPADGLSSGTGMWLRKIFVPSENVDCGIDCTKIGSITFTITAADKDYFEGMFGGGVVVSCGPVSICPSDHNWISKSFWGCNDEELEITTVGENTDIIANKVGDYTYELVCPVDESNCVYPEVMDNADGYVQIALQEWGQDMSDIVVLSLELKDASGATIAKFDGDGNMIGGGAAAEEEAPVEEEVVVAPAEEEKPAAGNVDAATDSSKGSPDTGVADVAVVAGLAIVAAGAVLVSKKRK